MTRPSKLHNERGQRATARGSSYKIGLAYIWKMPPDRRLIRYVMP